MGWDNQNVEYSTKTLLKHCRSISQRSASWQSRYREDICFENGSEYPAMFKCQNACKSLLRLGCQVSCSTIPKRSTRTTDLQYPSVLVCCYYSSIFAFQKCAPKIVSKVSAEHLVRSARGFSPFIIIINTLFYNVGIKKGIQ